MTDIRRCAAAHPEDPSQCDGPAEAIRIVDRHGEEMTGCLRHGAVVLASLDSALVYPGPESRDGDAIEVYSRAQRLLPFAFGDLYDHAMSSQEPHRCAGCSQPS